MWTIGTVEGSLVVPKHIWYAWSTLATRGGMGDGPVPIADPHATGPPPDALGHRQSVPGNPGMFRSDQEPPTVVRRPKQDPYKKRM